MAPVVPDKLGWWRATPEGAAWLDRLPQLIEQCVEQWSLELEPPFERGYASYCAPAGDAVLKLNCPEWETAHEADALAHWDGPGAARLLARRPRPPRGARPRARPLPGRLPLRGARTRPRACPPLGDRPRSGLGSRRPGDARLRRSTRDVPLRDPGPAVDT